MILALAGNELRRRFRDRSTLLLVLIGPILLATVISVAFGPGGRGFEATYAVVDNDRTDLSRGFFVMVLAQPGLGSHVTLRRAESAAEARRWVDDREVDAMIEVPAGYEERAFSGDAIAMAVVGRSDRAIATQVAGALVSDFHAQLQGAGLATEATLDLLDLPEGERRDAEEERLADAVQSVRVPVRLVNLADRSRADMASYYAPAMAIFLVFFVAAATARGLVEARRSGILDRMLASGSTSGLSVVAAYLIVVVMLGTVSITATTLVVGLLFRTSLAQPVTFVVIAGAVAASAAGIMLAIASRCSTLARYGAIAAFVQFSVALLGGVFFPPDRFPDLLRRVSGLSPARWALDGFLALTAGAGEVVRPVVVLLAIGSVGAALAARSVVTRPSTT